MAETSTYVEDFPPAKHVSRDLGIAYRFTGADSSEVRIPTTPHLLRPDGTVRSEVLLTVFDEAAGFLAVFSILPDWVATADFQFGVDPVDAGDDIELRAQVLKAGARLVVVDLEAWTAGRRTAWSTAAFSRVPRSGANADFEMPEPDTEAVHDLALEGSGFDAAYPDALGLRTVEASAGVVELAFSDYTRNSAGILHGGVVGTLSLRAAEVASGDADRWRAIDAHLHYLSPGRVGPFRTSAEPLVVGADRQVWRVELTDIGGGRAMTVATVTTVPDDRR
jgi:uncharacterized protein (TIGR00369 family)